MMTVAQLISILENLPGEAEVRLASQPSFPMQATVAEVVEVGTNDEDLAECAEAMASGYLTPEDEVECSAEMFRMNRENKRIVYIAEGSHPDDSPYLPGSATKKLGWGRY